jgi:hypothetical protein
MLKFTVNVKPQEYIKLNYQLVYSSPAMLIILVGCAIGFAAVVIKEGFGWQQFTHSIGNMLPLIVLVYTVIVLPITLFYRIRGLFNRMPALHEKQTYTIDEKGVYIKGKTFDAESEWEEYKSLQIKNNWIILWKAKNFGNFIPLSAIKTTEDLQQLIALAADNGLEIKGKVK